MKCWVRSKTDKAALWLTPHLQTLVAKVKMRQMALLETLRQFVDWDLRRKPITTAGNLTLLIGVLPWLALIATDGRRGSPTLSAPMMAAIAFDLIWFSYVGWRGWLLFQQAAARADRLYDRKGKYALPSEYADTESATKARRRRRKGS